MGPRARFTLIWVLEGARSSRADHQAIHLGELEGRAQPTRPPGLQYFSPSWPTGWLLVAPELALDSIWRRSPSEPPSGRCSSFAELGAQIRPLKRGENFCQSHSGAQAGRLGAKTRLNARLGHSTRERPSCLDGSAGSASSPSSPIDVSVASTAALELQGPASNGRLQGRLRSLSPIGFHLIESHAGRQAGSQIAHETIALDWARPLAVSCSRGADSSPVGLPGCIGVASQVVARQ